MLANLFMDELQGFTLSEPDVKLVFCTSVLDYVPGIVIKAQKANEVKYLIYSPLQMNINIFEEKPQMHPYETKAYHQGILTAEVENNEIFLNKETFASNKRCRNQKQAEMLIKAFVAMSDISLQQDYFKIPGQEIISPKIAEQQYWIMPHRGNYGFCVNATDSNVVYQRISLT